MSDSFATESKKIMSNQKNNNKNDWNFYKTVKIIYNQKNVVILENGDIAMIIDVYKPSGKHKSLTQLVKEIQEAIAKLTFQEQQNWKEQDQRWSKQEEFNKKQLEFNAKQEKFNKNAETEISEVRSLLLNVIKLNNLKTS